MGIGFKELLVILAIVTLLFGSKRLGTLRKDLGLAIQGFKKGIRLDSANALKEGDH